MLFSEHFRIIIKLSHNMQIEHFVIFPFFFFWFLLIIVRLWFVCGFVCIFVSWKLVNAHMNFLYLFFVLYNLTENISLVILLHFMKCQKSKLSGFGFLILSTHWFCGLSFNLKTLFWTLSWNKKLIISFWSKIFNSPQIATKN